MKRVLTTACIALLATTIKITSAASNNHMALDEGYRSALAALKGDASLACDSGTTTWLEIGLHKHTSSKYELSTGSMTPNRIAVVADEDGMTVKLYDETLNRFISDRDFHSVSLTSDGTIKWTLHEKKTQKYAVCHASSATCLGVIANRVVLVPSDDAAMVTWGLWSRSLSNHFSTAVQERLSRSDFKLSVRAPDGRRLVHVGDHFELSDLHDANEAQIALKLIEGGTQVELTDLRTGVQLSAYEFHARSKGGAQSHWALIEYEPWRFLMCHEGAKRCLGVQSGSDVVLMPYGDPAVMLWTLTEDTYKGGQPMYFSENMTFVPPAVLNASVNGIGELVRRQVDFGSMLMIPHQGSMASVWMRPRRNATTGHYDAVPASKQSPLSIQFTGDEYSIVLHDVDEERDLKPSDFDGVGANWTLVQRRPGRFSVCQHNTEKCLAVRNNKFTIVPRNDASECVFTALWPNDQHQASTKQDSVSDFEAFSLWPFAALFAVVFVASILFRGSGRGNRRVSEGLPVSIKTKSGSSFSRRAPMLRSAAYQYGSSSSLLGDSSQEKVK